MWLSLTRSISDLANLFSRILAGHVQGKIGILLNLLTTVTDFTRLCLIVVPSEFIKDALYIPMVLLESHSVKTCSGSLNANPGIATTGWT